MNVVQLTKLLKATPEPVSLAGYTIRDYCGRADIDIWLDIRYQAFRQEQPTARPWSRADFEAEMLGGDGFAPARIWIAECSTSSAAVGTVTLAMRKGGNRVLPVVHWLAVVPKWRRLGIARLLMAHLERYCWDQGMKKIGLETHRGWGAAVSLYQSLGYQ